MIALFLRRFWLRFSGTHPGVPANDGAVNFFLWLTIIEVALMAVTALVAAESGVVSSDALKVGMWLFIICDGFYALYSSVYYPDKVSIASTEGKWGHFDGLWRAGEYFCAFFVVFEGFLIPTLVASGIFAQAPQQTFIVAEAAVGLLASSSIIKMIRVPRTNRRRTHNTILLFLCVIASVVIGALLLVRALGGPMLPEGLSHLYGVLLIAYAIHNVSFSLLCPQCEQKRFGHLVGLLFGLLLIALWLLHSFGFVALLPEDVVIYFFITALVLFVGAASRYVFQPWAKRHLEKKEAEPQKLNGDDNAAHC